MDSSDTLLLDEILAGREEAWERLIARYEGRLLAFVRKRLGDRTGAEDVVQEAFIGLVTSLPHFDRRRDLESYLFAITAHKLTDALRKRGRAHEAARAADLGLELVDMPSGSRGASTIARSAERHQIEDQKLADALGECVAEWARKEDFSRLKVLELVFAQAWDNRRAAKATGLSPQQVASIKHQILSRLSDRLGGR